MIRDVRSATRPHHKKFLHVKIKYHHEKKIMKNNFSVKIRNLNQDLWKLPKITKPFHHGEPNLLLLSFLWVGLQSLKIYNFDPKYKF